MVLSKRGTAATNVNNVGLSIIGILVWYLNHKMNNNTVTIKKIMLNQLEKFDLLLIVIE